MGLTIITGSENNKIKHQQMFPIGIWRTKEDYDSIKEPFLGLKKACLDASRRLPFTVHWCLGGDMKSILILTGNVHAGHSTGHNCQYCSQTMKTRKDLSNNFTIEEDRPAGVKSNLLEGWIENGDIVIDPLHMLLRIYDTLFHRLWEKLGAVTGGENEAKRRLEPEMQKIVSYFKFFKSAETGEWKWPTINGSQRLQVLLNLDVEAVWNEAPVAARSLQACMREFAHIYQTQINNWHPSPGSDVQKQLQALIRKLCMKPMQQRAIAPRQTGRVRVGSKTQQASVRTGEDAVFNPTELMTLYFHMAFSHVGELIDRHGSLRAFSMQHLERGNNSDGAAWHAKNSRRRSTELEELLFRAWRIRRYEGLRAGAKFRCADCDAPFNTAGWLARHRAKIHVLPPPHLSQPWFLLRSNVFGQPY